MFRDKCNLHWQRIAEGNYLDVQDTINYRAYQRADGLELRVLMMNRHYKLLCINADAMLVADCSDLPLFDEKPSAENVIGMSDYTADAGIILQYLKTIDSSPAFAAVRAEILCFLGIAKPQPAQRAKELEQARIHFLEQVEQENDKLRARVAELEAYLEEYDDLMCAQTESIDKLQQLIAEDEMENEPQEHAALSRSF